MRCHCRGSFRHNHNEQSGGSGRHERLWLGHFDYWTDEGVIIFRYTFPLMERDEATIGEIRATIAAAVSAVDRFVPAFNFLIWAGKSPREAIDAVMFETQGEA